MRSCNVECADMNLILCTEDPVAVAVNAKDAIRQSVRDVDMEIHSLMKRNLIIYQNFKIKSNPLNQ